MFHLRRKASIFELCCLQNEVTVNLSLESSSSCSIHLPATVQGHFVTANVHVLVRKRLHDLSVKLRQELKGLGLGRVHGSVYPRFGAVQVFAPGEKAGLAHLPGLGVPRSIKLGNNPDASYSAGFNDVPDVIGSVNVGDWIKRAVFAGILEHVTQSCHRISDEQRLPQIWENLALEGEGGVVGDVPVEHVHLVHLNEVELVQKHLFRQIVSSRVQHHAPRSE